jgi:hypothetical protein
MTFEQVQDRLERVIESGSIPAESVEDIHWMLKKLEAFRLASLGVFTARHKSLKKSPSADGKAFIAAFHELYLANCGSKPTWGAKEAKTARDLVKQHGLEVCKQRAEFMFSGKGPAWIKSRDITTLRMHFDKFVAAEQRLPSLPGFDDLFEEQA